MKVLAYLAVSADEDRARQFASSVGEGTGVLKELRKSAPSEGGKAPYSWLWRTKRREIDSADVEAGIERFLEDMAEVRAVIVANRRDLADVYLTVIAQYDEHDSPRGYSLSPKCVALLAELGGAFEIDAVSTLDASLV